MLNITDERIGDTTAYQSEYEEWVKNGLDKAEEIIHKSDIENIKQ